MRMLSGRVSKHGHAWGAILSRWGSTCTDILNDIRSIKRIKNSNRAHCFILAPRLWVSYKKIPFAQFLDSLSSRVKLRYDSGTETLRSLSMAAFLQLFIASSTSFILYLYLYWDQVELGMASKKTKRSLVVTTAVIPGMTAHAEQVPVKRRKRRISSNPHRLNGSLQSQTSPSTLARSSKPSLGRGMKACSLIAGEVRFAAGRSLAETWP